MKTDREMHAAGKPQSIRKSKRAPAKKIKNMQLKEEEKRVTPTRTDRKKKREGEGMRETTSRNSRRDCRRRRKGIYARDGPQRTALNGNFKRRWSSC